MDRMPAPQRLRSAFRHTNEVNLLVCNELRNGFDGLFNWNVLIDASTLVKIKTLGATQFSKAVVDALPHEVWPTDGTG